ncbi:hypothetical protein PN290_07380 [Romboutsia sp. 1001216sp1]|uniref:hypothetical protein n=1 Tax=Romboutsia sp. 1001216sp1 TaxID=2986997 RepID=UPI0018AB399C|nr:hypothetical protein [Romboutsia sp. 1001216sp1]MDB8799200.1 hypothetical protein [Romboutsia sp. 1001216sp1]
MEKNNKIKDINEYKKRKKNKHKIIRAKKIKKMIFILSLSVGVFMTLIINICGYSVIGELKYSIGNLKKELRKEEIRLEEAKANADTKTSIQEIEKRAREELNMDYPTKNQIRYIQIK